MLLCFDLVSLTEGVELKVGVVEQQALGGCYSGFPVLEGGLQER